MVVKVFSDDQRSMWIIPKQRWDIIDSLKITIKSTQCWSVKNKNDMIDYNCNAKAYGISI